jgi:hypothetical protein
MFDAATDGGSDSDDVVFLYETGPVRPPIAMHFFKEILTHRIVTRTGRIIACHEIIAGDVGVFQFLVRYSANDEELWVDECAFTDADDEYCIAFIDYCAVHGIQYQ